MYPISKDLFVRTLSESSNCNACAKSLGVSRGTVFNLKKKFGIPNRTTQLDQCPNSFTERQLAVITGSMLGDGSISKAYNMNCLFCERHSDKQLGYLTWKFDCLKPFSRKITKETIDGCRLPQKGSYDNYISHRMETVRHALFSELEKLWYKRNKRGQYILDDRGRRMKILPPELNLTPLSVAIWFVDDGRMIHSRKTGIISTDGFTHEECERLCDGLRPLGIKSAVTKGKKGRWEISTSKHSYDTICEILQSHIPCECVAYKHQRRITNP